MTDVLLHGDCLELMEDLPANSVAMVLADLPYGMTAAPWDKRLDLGALWEQWRRVVEPCGVIALFAQQPFTTDVISSRRPWFKHMWYWVKNTAAGGLYSMSQPMRAVEDIAVFAKVAHGKEAFDCADVPEHEECRAYLRGERARLGLTGKAIGAIIGRSDAAAHWFQRSEWTLPTEAQYAALQRATGGFARPWSDLRDLRGRGDKYAGKRLGNSHSERQRLVRYHPPGVSRLAAPKPHGCTNSALYANHGRVFGQTTTGHPTNVLRYAAVAGAARVHPTQKPVALLEYLIRTYTDPGDTVLDCCMGSGSTCVAAVNTNRHYIGIELDERYCNIARRRVEKARNADRQTELEGV